MSEFAFVLSELTRVARELAAAKEECRRASAAVERLEAEMFELGRQVGVTTGHPMSFAAAGLEHRAGQRDTTTGASHVGRTKVRRGSEAPAPNGDDREGANRRSGVQTSDGPACHPTLSMFAPTDRIATSSIGIDTIDRESVSSFPPAKHDSVPPDPGAAKYEYVGLRERRRGRV